MTMVFELCMHLLSVRCVLTIFSRFRWLKASELMLFFFNFKAGFYFLYKVSLFNLTNR